VRLCSYRCYAPHPSVHKANVGDQELMIRLFTTSRANRPGPSVVVLICLPGLHQLAQAGAAVALHGLDACAGHHRSPGESLVRPSRSRRCTCAVLNELLIRLGRLSLGCRQAPSGGWRSSAP